MRQTLIEEIRTISVSKALSIQRRRTALSSFWSELPFWTKLMAILLFWITSANHCFLYSRKTLLDRVEERSTTMTHLLCNRFEIAIRYTGDKQLFFGCLFIWSSPESECWDLWRVEKINIVPYLQTLFLLSSSFERVFRNDFLHHTTVSYLLCLL